MVIAQAIAEAAPGVPGSGLLTEDTVREVFAKGLGGGFTGQKVLVLIPDHTRPLPLPELFRMVVEVLHDVRELNVMVALGTHPEYSEDGLNHLVGITAEERATTFKHVGLLNRAWDDPAALTSLGVIDQDEIKQLAGANWHPSLPDEVDIRINKAVWIRLLSTRPTGKTARMKAPSTWPRPAKKTVQNKEKIMRYGMNLRSEGALDLVSLGGLVHRLDPGIIPFRKATHCDIHVSGGEFNVAANLSDCFGLRTGIVTAMVNYPIGDLIAERVKAMGVIPFYKHFEHNGVTGPNMATVYSDRGQGVRAPVVFYNRSNEAAAQLKPGDFDWPKIFADGVRWFHSGGIFAALSETTGELIIEGMKAAKAVGAVTSIDLNYRAKLWNLWGGHEVALKVLKRIVENVDVIVGNEEDLQMGLGIAGPEVAAKSKLDPSVFFGMIDKVTAMYPNVKVVATTLREVHSTNRHSWSAVAWINGKTYQAPTCELEVLDRVGGGDGYAAGFFYGLLSGASEQEAVNLGWAHGALLTTFPGDTTMATVEQVRAFAKGGSARIQR